MNTQTLLAMIALSRKSFINLTFDEIRKLSNTYIGELTEKQVKDTRKFFRLIYKFLDHKNSIKFEVLKSDFTEFDIQFYENLRKLISEYRINLKDKIHFFEDLVLLMEFNAVWMDDIEKYLDVNNFEQALILEQIKNNKINL
jgi:hypothetical protein